MRRGGYGLCIGALLLLAASVPVQAQPSSLADTLAPRPLAAEALDAYRADADFVYERGGGVPPVSFWDRLVTWFLAYVVEPILKLLFIGGKPIGLYILVGAILVYAVLKILRMDGGGVFKRSVQRSAASGLTEEELRAMDFPALIAETEASGDLRRATRLQYLHLLRALVEAERVDYAPQHTNRVYVGQLAGTALHAPFADATTRFEAAYYGDASVDIEAYDVLRADVVAVRSALGPRVAAPLAEVTA